MLARTPSFSLLIALIFWSFSAVAADISEGEIISAVSAHLSRTDSSACLGYSAFPRYADPQESTSDYSITRYKPFIRLGLMKEKLYRAGEARPAEDTSSVGEKMVATEYALFLTETGKKFLTSFDAPDQYTEAKKDFCYGIIVPGKVDSWVANGDSQVKVKLYRTVKLHDWANDTEFQNTYKISANVAKIESEIIYLTLTKTNVGWKVF